MCCVFVSYAGCRGLVLRITAYVHVMDIGVGPESGSGECIKNAPVEGMNVKKT